jgi:hypothetical protein
LITTVEMGFNLTGRQAQQFKGTKPGELYVIALG